MSIDLLDWNKKKEGGQQQQEGGERDFKKEIEQLYGYDEEQKQNEETLMNKFMHTIEKMRDKRKEQMRKMID